MRCARGLTEHGHVVGIAAEGRNIFLHPAQSERHIAQGDICRNAGDLQKAVHIHAVIRRHQHYSVTGESLPVETGIVIVAVRTAAAGNPEHDRALCRPRSGRPDVQTQTVAASRHAAGHIPGSLKRNVPRRHGLHRAAPGIDKFRSGQPLRPHIGVLSAGYPPENMHAADDAPL